MQTRSKIALFCAAVAFIAAAVFGCAFIASRARKEKIQYVNFERQMAICDFAAAIGEMEDAITSGDLARLNFSAGKAHAYLSRTGLPDTDDIYKSIGLIASGEYGVVECGLLREAAERAMQGNFRSLAALRSVESGDGAQTEETTEDQLSAKTLERIGKSRDDVALTRATAFACPNAAFHPIECEDGSFKFSGDNVFIAVGGSSNRVLLYCFDREIDPRYSISREDAVEAAINIVKKEKLKISGEPKTEFCDGIYRNVWYDSADESVMVALEIYSDTGRLRLYDAVNYYKK